MLYLGVCLLVALLPLGTTATPPLTVTVTPVDVSSPGNVGVKFDVVFSETVTAFSPAHIRGTGISNPMFVSVVAGTSPGHYTATIPMGTANVDIWIPAGVVFTPSGTSNTLSNTATVIYAHVTSSVAACSGTWRGVTSVCFSVTFSAPVTGFASGGLVLGPGTGPAEEAVITTLSSTHYEVYVPRGRVNASLATALGAATANSDETPTVSSHVMIIPWKPVTVTVTPSTEWTTGSAWVDFDLQFSEDVNSFNDALVVTGGSIASKNDATAITPSHYRVGVYVSLGSASLYVGAGVATAVADALPSLESATAVMDYRIPLEVTGVEVHDCTSPFQVVVYFPMVLGEFTNISAIGVDGGTAADLVYASGFLSASFAVLPETEGTITISIPSGAFSSADAPYYPTAASNVLSVTPICIPRIRIAASGFSGHDGVSEFGFSLVASHPVQLGWTANPANIAVIGASGEHATTITSQDSTHFTFTATPIGCVPMNASVTAGHIPNLAGSTWNEGSNGFAVECAAPVLTLAYVDGAPGIHNGPGGPTVFARITASRPVSAFGVEVFGFIAADVATWTTVVDGTEWLLELAPTDMSILSLQIGFRSVYAVSSPAYGCMMSNQLTWTATQAGLFAVTYMRLDTGGVQSVPATDGAIAFLDAPAYGFAAAATVCLTRHAAVNSQGEPLGVLGGSATLTFGIDGDVSDLYLSVDSSGTGHVTYNNALRPAGSTFNLTWTASQLNGAERCFSWTRSSFVTAASLSCSPAAGFYMTMGVTTTESDLNCVPGNTGGCDALLGGIQRVRFYANVSPKPTISLLDNNVIATGHFVAGSGPPALTEPSLTQDAPMKLFGFERGCPSQSISALTRAHQEALWDDWTNLNFAGLFTDISLTIASGFRYQDVTSAFLGQTGDTDATGLVWTDLEAGFVPGDSQFGWQGALCGPRSRRFLLVSLVPPDSGPLPGIAEIGFSFSNAIAECSGVPSYVDPNPPIILDVSSSPCQAGIFSLTGMTLGAKVGGDVVYSYPNGPTRQQFSAPVYGFGASVAVCLTRAADPELGTPVAGAATLSFGVPSDVADLYLTADTTGSGSLSYDDALLAAGATFDLTWTDSQLDGAVRCFSWTRSSFVTAATSLCGSTGGFEMTVGVTTTDVDPNCVPGNTEGCDALLRGIQLVAFDAGAYYNPAIVLLEHDVIATDHFVAGSGPPALTELAFAANAPMKLFGFQRGCPSDTMSLLASADQEALWNDWTTITFAALFTDLSLAIASGFQYQDITSAFRGQTGDTDATGLVWTDLVAGFVPGDAQFGWQGGLCGPGSRRFVLVSLVPPGSGPLPGIAHIGFSFYDAITVCSDYSYYFTYAPIVLDVAPGQAGIFSLTSMTLGATVGGDVVYPDTDGPTQLKFTAPVYGFGAAVTVCLTRAADPELGGAPIAGAATLRFGVPSDVADLYLTADTTGSGSLSYDDALLAAGATFDLTWTASQLDGAVRCFSWTRSSFVTAATSLCGDTAEFVITVGVAATDVDSRCNSEDTSGCPDNQHFFVGALSTIVFASTATDPLSIHLVPSGVIASEYFVPGNAPPSLAGISWAQHAPTRLFVFERDCGSGGIGGLPIRRQQQLWYDFTSVNSAGMFTDVLLGIKGGFVYADVTELFNTVENEGYDYYSNATGWLWTDLLARIGATSETVEFGWTGAECGPLARKFVFVSLVPDSATLPPPGEARVSFALDTAISACAWGYANPSPPLFLDIRNSPTETSSGGTLTIVTPHQGVYMCPGFTVYEDGTFGGCIGVIAEDAGATPPVSHELVTITLGSRGVRAVAGVLDFSPTVLSTMCTTVPDDFRVVVEKGGETGTNAEFDAVWGGEWPTMSEHEVGSTYTWSADEPFYPNNADGNNPIFGTSWSVWAVGTGIFQTGNTADNELRGFQMSFRGLMEDYEGCTNADGSPVVTTVNDPDNSGNILKHMSITVDRWRPDGPLEARRVVHTQSYAVSLSVQIPSDTTLSQASAVSLGLGLLSVTAEGTSVLGGSAKDCDYTGLEHVGFDTLDHACSGGGANAAFVAIEQSLLIRVPRSSNLATASDVCILPPAYVEFMRADPTDLTQSLESCYGVARNAGSAILVTGYADDATMSTFRVRYQTPFVNLWSGAHGANDFNTFATCSDGASRNDFSIQLAFMQPVEAGYSCAEALAARLPVDQWRTFSAQTVSLTSPLAISPGASILLNGGAEGWADVMLESYRVPDFLPVGGTSWETRGATDPITSDAFAFTPSDWVGLTLRTSGTTLLGTTELFIRRALGATLNLDSPLAYCISPLGTLTDTPCPTEPGVGSSIDSIVWDIWIAGSPSPASLNPIAATFYIVDEFVPNPDWSVVPQSARWSVASSSTRAAAGTATYYCTNAADGNYRAGADSETYYAARLEGRLDSFWHHLNGLTTPVTGGRTVDPPFRAADGIAFPLAHFPAQQPLLFTLEAVLFDCRDWTPARRRLSGTGLSVTYPVAAASQILVIEARKNETIIIVLPAAPTVTWYEGFRTFGGSDGGMWSMGVGGPILGLCICAACWWCGRRSAAKLLANKVGVQPNPGGGLMDTVV